MNKQLAAVLALGLTGSLALSGCSGSGDDPAAADPSASASRSGGPDPSRAPSVAPATGARVEQPGATMNAPDGFTHDPDMVDFLDSASKGTSLVTLGEDPGWRTGDLDEAAESSRRSKSYQAPERLADTELAGEPAYHLSGPVNAFSRLEEFAAIHDDHLVTVSFELDSSLPKAARQKMVDSALATFEWR